MGAPKSVTRIKNGHVEYTSEVDKAQYYIFELTRAALRDVGKYVAKTFKDTYYSYFTKRSGDAGKATKYKVWSSANTKYPRVQIGLKTGRVDGFYAYFQEFGSSKTPKLGILTNTVQSNINTIREIESKYLSAIDSSSDAQLDSMINDSEEYEGDADS